MSEQEKWLEKLKENYTASSKFNKEAYTLTKTRFKHKLLWTQIKIGVLGFGVVCAVIAGFVINVAIDSHQKKAVPVKKESAYVAINRTLVVDQLASELDKPENWQDMDEMIELENELWDSAQLDNSTPFPFILLTNLK